MSPLRSRTLYLIVASALVVLPAAAQFAGRTLPDTAWLLYAAGRMLDGARLYVDLIEVNPPLIVWLNLVPVWLARLFDLSPVLVYRVLVLLLALASVAVSAALVRCGARDAPMEERRLLVLLLLFVTVTLPREDYGEREHLLLALALPYLFLAWVRAEGISVSRPAALAIGVAAGVGMALKPYFALLWLAVEAYLWRAARVRPVLRPESLAVVAVGAAYLAAVLLLTPEYLQVVRTMAGPYYEFLSNDLWFTALLGDGAPIPLAAALAWLALHRTGRRSRLWGTLLAATLALYLSAVLQHKGWRYHFYPSMATGVLLLGLIAVKAQRPLRTAVARAYAAMAAAVAGGLALWTLLACVLQALDPLNPRYDADPDIGRLAPLVRAEVAGGKVMMLSWSMASAFPLLTYAGAESASRFNALWILGAVYRDELRRPEPLRYREPAEMGPLERYLNRSVAEDLRRHRPELVLALRAAPDLPQWGLRRLDHVRYFSRDPGFAAEFAHYGFLTAVGQYFVFRRLRPGEPRREPPATPPLAGRDPKTRLPRETAPVGGEIVFAALAFAAIFILVLAAERRGGSVP